MVRDFLALAHLKRNREAVGIDAAEFAIRTVPDLSILGQFGADRIEIGLRPYAPNDLPDRRSCFDRRRQSGIIGRAQVDGRAFRGAICRAAVATFELP